MLEADAQAARRWSAMQSRQTGVFCASDEYALVFISECAHMGFAVPIPVEVSVEGFEDIDFADRVLLSLTTSRQARSEMGRAAAKRLIAMMKAAHGDGKKPFVYLQGSVAATLVDRSSTGPAGT